MDASLRHLPVGFRWQGGGCFEVVGAYRGEQVHGDGRHAGGVVGGVAGGVPYQMFQVVPRRASDRQ
ncbi:hypothetical protein [Streptosporangium saharense]|uniref:hypothetical protein n=1 Tax=Streptosporangium saharense TaxID=1706840 RepID=UPI003442B50E